MTPEYKFIKVKLKDIHPNPFRRIKEYPIIRGKVDDLKESIETNGYIPNIAARVRNGVIEQAYGHHRHKALLELYGPSFEITLAIRDLSDAEMIQMMARENGENYKTNAIVLIESIRATVDAYAAGQVSAEEMPMDPKTNTKYLIKAPSFIATGCAPVPGAHIYAAKSIAKFLGMIQSGNGEPQERFIAAFWALELIEQGLLSEAKLKDLGTTQLYAIVKELRKQRDAAKEKEQRLLAEAAKKREEAEKRQEALIKQQVRDEELRKTAIAKAKVEEDDRKAKAMRAEAERVSKKAEEDAKREVAEIKASLHAAKKKEDDARKEAAAVKSDIKEAAEEIITEVKERSLPIREIAAKGEEIADAQARRAGREVVRDRAKEQDEYYRSVLDEVKQAKASDDAVKESKLKTASKILKVAGELVEAGYRALAKLKHPDHGGSQEDMATLNAAAEWLRTVVKEGV